ncbi:hypothetical protein C8J57DRAFT_225013 [Mycena rebaudengoi]|nr:hypothetical protein C8J57DRAFT_225013 [Mycena rebaudengoi]
MIQIAMNEPSAPYFPKRRGCFHWCDIHKLFSRTHGIIFSQHRTRRRIDPRNQSYWCGGSAESMATDYITALLPSLLGCAEFSCHFKLSRFPFRSYCFERSLPARAKWLSGDMFLPSSLRSYCSTSGRQFQWSILVRQKFIKYLIATRSVLLLADKFIAGSIPTIGIDAAVCPSNAHLRVLRHCCLERVRCVSRVDMRIMNPFSALTQSIIVAKVNYNRNCPSNITN